MLLRHLFINKQKLLQYSLSIPNISIYGSIKSIPNPFNTIAIKKVKKATQIVIISNPNNYTPKSLTPFP